jgi:hypothetical protein
MRKIIIAESQAKTLIKILKEQNEGEYYTVVKGYVTDYRTPMEAMRIRREELAKLADADEKRQDNEWGLDNPDIDDEGLAANALFDYLVYQNELNEMDEDTKNEIQEKKKRYDEIQERYAEIKDTATPEELEELEDEGIDILNEIEELQEGAS